MKIVRFVGGLGNQLFQYAFYKAVQQYDSETYADLSYFQKNNIHQGFELENVFDISLNIASDKLIKELGYSSLFSHIKRRIRRKGTYLVEKCLGYDSSLEVLPQNAYLDGFWQSYKYFDPISSILQNELCYTGHNLSTKTIKAIDDIKQSNSIAIHIRLTDYLKKQNSHFINLSKTNYYTKAIEKISKEFGNIKFYIFSDDIYWVQRNTKFQNAVYVDWNSGCDCYQDMIMMSYCSGIIMANSTFSWWGAWLNPLKKRKYVICPFQWYNKKFVDGREIKTEDLFLPEWFICDFD